MTSRKATGPIPTKAQTFTTAALIQINTGKDCNNAQNAGHAYVCGLCCILPLIAAQGRLQIGHTNKKVPNFRKKQEALPEPHYSAVYNNCLPQYK